MPTRRPSKTINLLFLAFVLALAGTLAASKPPKVEMVELYPYHYNLANPHLVAEHLLENGFRCKLLADNRVIVERDELASSLASIAMQDTAILKGDLIFKTQDPNRPHALNFQNGAEHLQLLEQAIALSAETEVVSLVLPELEYFVEPRLPAVLTIDASARLAPETLQGIETMLQLYGAEYPRLVLRYVD